ncbi:pteridine-dependent deoxygenase [Lysobacter cavernae]|uniref:Pteridine-dependent deoxygenase n=1 Tax=Lysobacter cavernae TaxID=1685901 RepID=A0ABV7RM44_9GAMM
MSAVRSLGVTPPRLAVDYVDAASVDGTPQALLAADDTLAVFGFGAAAPYHDDPRYLRVALEPFGAASFEVWRGAGPVTHGRDGDIAWAQDGALLFGAIELDERPGSGIGGTDIEATAAAIYAQLPAFLQQRGYPHLLRVWNYLDGITVGEGDDERYRVFCVGRARGLGAVDPAMLPAATAVGQVTAGHADDVPRLQVYWLAARSPGTPLENPRQVSAYRYPRQYGPQPPSFARAMLPPAGAAMPLLLSGTAAIVGHESRHADSVLTQLDETLANFDSLLAAARAQRPDLPPHFGVHSRLKVYVRNQDELAQVAAALDARLGPGVPRIVLHAAVCRRELRIEIDGVHA